MVHSRDSVPLQIASSSTVAKSLLRSKPPSWDCWVNACNRQACWATRSRRSSFREAGSRQQWLLGRFLVLWSKLDNLPGVLERNPLPSFSEVVRYVELDYFCHVIPAFSTSSGLLLPLDITRLRWSLLLVEANLVSGVGEISPLHSCGSISEGASARGVKQKYLSGLTVAAANHSLYGARQHRIREAALLSNAHSPRERLFYFRSVAPAQGQCV
jgi:hypothetical protein